MTSSAPGGGGGEERRATRHDRIAEALAASSWCVAPDFLDGPATLELAEDCARRRREGAFRQARIGRRDDERIDTAVRGDEILWLDPSAAGKPQDSYFREMEALRQAINARLFLGLFDFEAHFAVYPPVAAYRRHRDRHAGTDIRVVSTVLYLNQGWSDEDGGQLRLHLAGSGGVPEQVDVTPRGGTLAVFLSAVVEHEVLRARRERASIAGWFRRRA